MPYDDCNYYGFIIGINTNKQYHALAYEINFYQSNKNINYLG